MKKILFPFFFLSVLAHAQSEPTSIAEFEAKLSKLDESVKSQEALIDASEKKIIDHKVRILEIDELISQREANKMRAIGEVKVALKSARKYPRRDNRKSFFKCISEKLQKESISDVERCETLNPSEFSSEEKKLVEAWRMELERPAEVMEYDRMDIRNSIKKADSQIKQAQKKIKEIAETKRNLVSEREALKTLEQDQILLKNNSQYLNCDSNTPLINLEDKIPFKGSSFNGPFYKIPRDNQDGVGTCFGNVAKNMLIGLSKGKDVASFLDLALHYKTDSELLESAIDGGDACGALKKVESLGFCPQNYAPVETGEKNIYLQGLTGKSDLDEQSQVISLLQEFLKGKDQFKKTSPQVAENYFKKAQFIIEKIKSNPRLKLPLPVARVNIPRTWKLKEIYIINKSSINLSETQFITNYRERYRDFFPLYVKALQEGKGAEEIFDIYKANMGPFFKELKLEANLEDIKNAFISETQAEFETPNLKASIKESMDFLKELSGKESLSEEEFLKECANSLMQEELSFLAKFHPLIDHLKNIKVDTKNLFNANGEFKSPRELMQLAVAPACLNSANRQKTGYAFSCDRGYTFISTLKNSSVTEAEKIKKVRERVLSSLLQGYPVGNTFDRHINTIVGLRFNKELSRCEYNIRESQTGTSAWQSEKEIFKKIAALTEVRRK